MRATRRPERFGDAEQASREPVARRPGARQENASGPDYKAFSTHEFDETIAAEDLCDPEELERLRSFT